MTHRARNAILIVKLIRKAEKAGWTVIRHGRTLPAVRCKKCGAVSALQFKNNDKLAVACFRCSK